MKHFYSAVVLLCCITIHSFSNVSHSWRSLGYKGVFQSIAVGDISGDGKNEVIVLSEDKIHLYKHKEGQLAQVQGAVRFKRKYFLSIDLIDLTNDGKKELLVSALNGNKRFVSSLVLTYEKGALKTLVDDSPFLFKVISHGTEDKILGQEVRLGRGYSQKINELLWNGRSFKRTKEFSFDNKHSVLGTTMIGDSYLSYNHQGYIGVYGQQGAQTYETSEKHGLTNKELVIAESSKEQERRVIYFPARMEGINSKSHDGQLITMKNEVFAKSMLKNWRILKKGTVESFVWDGVQLRLGWASKTYDGYFSDVVVGDFDNNGSDEVVSVLVTTQRKFLRKKNTSTILVFPYKKNKESVQK